MKVIKPIFIIGTGRNGSTILHDIFTYHPEMSWPSTLCNDFPEHISFHKMFIKLIDCPVIGTLLRKKFSASEAYPLWNMMFRGFGRPYRDLVASDLTNRAKKKMHQYFGQMLTDHRDRLLIKITGWPRIGFLNEAFPDAKFIHLVRDGRAVSNSMLNVDFWDGWHGPWNWRWGKLPKQYEREWYNYDQSFIALAAICWKMLIEATERAKQKLEPDNFFELRYEDFILDPVETFSDILYFCELEFPHRFNKHITTIPLKNMNFKWEKDLNTNQQEIIEKILKYKLSWYRYCR